MNDEGVIFAYYLNEAGVWENSDLSTVESYEGIKTWVHLDFKNENTKRWLYERSGLEDRITSYNVCYTKLLRTFSTSTLYRAINSGIVSIPIEKVLKS